MHYPFSLAFLALPLLSAYAQQRRDVTILSYPNLTAINSRSARDAFVFKLNVPPTNALAVSVALCASSSDQPQILYTNDTSVSAEDVLAGNGGVDVWEVLLKNGSGSVTTFALEGAMLVATGISTRFEVGVAHTEPLHTLHTSNTNVPLLGDTTSNQALVFSPSLAVDAYTIRSDRSRWPNYTFPSANLTMADPPSNVSATNATLELFPTANLTGSTLPLTGCALQNASAQNLVESQSLWHKDRAGWRMEFLVGGLTPQTNYTAFVVTNGTRVSGPITFVTKTAAFSCPLVHNLPYCPGVSYAVPLPPPPIPLAVYDANTIPEAVSAPILEYMTNFTVALSTFACGRDQYSPLKTCAECHEEYRRWLCAVQFTRCSETTASLADLPVQPALVVQKGNTDGRNPNLPRKREDYQELLPCLETCQAAERACPFFLGFRCPIVRFNANESYGVGYIDSGEEGEEGGGTTGAAQDRWGNVWCNAG